MKGPVEKGRKWRFEVKIEIAPISLNIGTQAGFHVRNTVAHLFLDLRSKIWRISVLLLLKTDTKKTTGPRILGWIPLF